MLNASDWSGVYVDKRTITIDGKTYNLNSDLSYNVEVPKSSAFKRKYRRESIHFKSDHWTIKTIGNMNNTSNMLVTAVNAKG